MTAEHAVVRVNRTIPAPPNRVYRAWLDPETLRRWLAPGTLEALRAAMPHVAVGVGWEMALDKLAAAIGQASAN